MKKIYQFVGSLYVGIALLIIITLLSVAGIIIPQGRMEELYFVKYGERIGSFILFCGLDHIFSTVWYKIILLIFSVNISVCTFNRLKKIFSIFTNERQQIIVDREALESFPTKFTFDVKENPQKLTKHIIFFFKKRFFFVSLKPSSDKIMIMAQNKWLKEIGSTLFHFGIIPLLIGGFINQKMGFSYLQMLKEGEVAKVKNNQLWIKCNKFEIEKTNKGAIKDYRSSLVILDSIGNKLKEKIIEVNDPLVYRKIKFYQSSYQIEKDSSIKNINLLLSGGEFAENVKTLILKSCGETLSVNKDIKIVAERFVPDFCLDIETKKVFSRSSEHNNPALLITLLKNNEKIFSGWHFKNINSFHHNTHRDYKISFISYQTPNDRLTTGILIKKAPGNILIWAGILFMTCGILIVFSFASTEKYIIAIVKEDESSKIIFTSPSKLEEFGLDKTNKLKEKLKKELKQLYQVVEQNNDTSF
ncbi:MAG: cytochrome c biogenesis protein ResB [Chitinispirillaceae bacterium]|nr:cytochrome c biogenesis protein ResB [Chitinispirillaceae bacterium]